MQKIWLRLKYAGLVDKAMISERDKQSEKQDPR